MPEETWTADQAIQAGREHRHEMARWLALEVLLTDEIANQDDLLLERLSVLQERVEEDLRAKTAAAAGRAANASSPVE
jgi:hypothetical protein